MEPVTEPGIDLFADNLPSMDEIKTLSEFVHSGEANMISFNEQVESNMSRTGQKGCLATGIGLFILGRNAEAAEKLAKGTDCLEKYLYLAYALRRTGSPSAFRSAFRRLAVLNKADPDPHPLEVALFHDHPTISQRLALASAPHPSSDEP